jgi:hypothetical protein
VEGHIRKASKERSGVVRIQAENRGSGGLSPLPRIHADERGSEINLIVRPDIDLTWRG